MTEEDKAQDQRLAATVVAGGRLRGLLLELWQRTRLDWGFVSDRLSQTFRKETWVGSSERRFVAETLYGLVRHVRRVDAAIASGRRGASARPPRDDERLIAYFVLEGALTMALFGLGSGVWLIGGPWIWIWLRSRLNATRAEWGTRVAGGMLFAVAAWALWMDLIYKPSLWCR